MDAESLKPDAMILVGLIGAWLGALLLFTPIYAVMTESPASQSAWRSSSEDFS